MATPSPTSSPPSDSNPNSAPTSPQKNPPPSTSQPLPPPQTTLVASAAARKTQPVLWTQEETLLLIESYKENWYAAGRGPLKSSHWEEIAMAVSARSGVDRSATQCRHKIEKLRKRFKAERQSMGPISIWPFYSQMEELDSSNTAPISARPLTRLPPSSEDDDEEEDERESKSRSINYIVRRPGTVNRFAGESGGLLQWGHKERSKRKRRDGGEKRRKEGARAVACEIRSFAERVMVMEKKKMEFAKETVKLRKEMEIKRLKLIQTSQAQLLQSLSSVFGSF